MTLSLGFMKLLEWLIELREIFYSPKDRFIIKGYKARTDRWKRCGGQTGMELPCCPSTLLSKQQHVFVNLGALPTLSVGFFLRQDKIFSWFFLRFSWDKTIHRQDWLPDCHWPLAAELTYSLSPRPGGVAESFNHRSVPLASCPQPWKSQGHEPR